MAGNPLFIGGSLSTEKVRDTHITPFLGYKIANLVSTRDGLMFRGPHRKRLPYHQLDTSVCKYSRNRKDHSIEACSCGFYGYTHIAKASLHWTEHADAASSCAILEVAFSGEVEVCEEGYRASMQRVTRVILPPCQKCNVNAGTHITGYGLRRYASICDECLGASTRKVRETAMTFDAFSRKHSSPDFPAMLFTSASSETSYVTDRTPAFEVDRTGLWYDLLTEHPLS